MAERAEDTTSLFRQYQKTKDQAVRDRLILTYAPLVKYVAGRLGSGSRRTWTRATSSRTGCSG